MKILRQLSEAMGVSGAEGEVRSTILDLIEKHVDDIQTDTMGNLLAFKRGTGRDRLTIMVDAHMDEVGLMVNGYDSNGMLRVVAIGGLDDRILLGKRVLVGPSRLPGVIGAKPIHLLDSDEREKVVKIDALRVDIGATSKQTAESKAPLGTRIGFESLFIEDGRIARGKAFDDRAGCAILIHLLQGKRFPFDLVASFTVQEEVGGRGAQVAAHRAKPELALVLEANIADDLPPDDDEEETMPTTRLGAGPALSIMDRGTLYDQRLNGWLIETAEKMKIPYQMKTPGVGGTDGSTIHLQQGGIPVAALSVPCRYIHTPTAMLAKSDYQNTLRLAEAALKLLDKNTLKR